MMSGISGPHCFTCRLACRFSSTARVCGAADRCGILYCRGATGTGCGRYSGDQPRLYQHWCQSDTADIRATVTGLTNTSVTVGKWWERSEATRPTALSQPAGFIGTRYDSGQRHYDHSPRFG